ncbi:hypothetical protein [Micromonospora sp. CPCC 206061]|uniref:hypothetical protein n=1 Tax=Micromonospora sp. CPCC 206061 TaxID=3122410 RepID=UPI002FF37EB1
MTRFRQALLDELQSRVVADPVPAKARHRLTRPRLAFGGALVAAAAAIATVLATSGGGGPAYAVTKEKDGTLAVAVNRPGDPGDANRELAVAVDDKVKILRPSAPEDCPVEDRGTRMKALPDTVWVRLGEASASVTRVRVRPESLPDGVVVVLVALTPLDGGKPAVQLDFYKAPGPKCVVAPTR